MEYGNCIDGDLFNVLKGSVVNMNNQYNDRIDPNQYIGWSTITEWAPLPRELFTKRTVKIIQTKVYEYLLKNKKANSLETKPLLFNTLKIGNFTQQYFI